METHFIIFILLSVSCLCNGHLKILDIVSGAHQQIHNTVHDVAGSVFGGFGFNIGGHVTRRPVQHTPTHGEQETVVIVVEETNQGGQGQDRPQRPYGVPPNHGYNPNQGHNPNHGFNPNQGYNPNQEFNPNQGYNPNQGFNPNHGHNRPYHHGNYGPPHYQNGQNNAPEYGHGNNGPVQNFPGKPPQNGYQNQGGPSNNNQNNHGTDNVQSGYGNGENPNNNDNNNGYNNKPNQNENVVTRPEQPKPNLSDNYKPTETSYGQQNDAHKTGNDHKETNDKTTKKPANDEPLFVPLNDYTYQVDKISVNAPKREADKTITPAAAEDSDEEFPIDIRFKDE